MKYPSQGKARSWRHCSLWVYLIALGCAGLPVASLAAEPLALQGIMKEMGRNMQRIVDGLSREDYALVEKAALAIAEHPQPTFGEKMRILGFVSGEPRPAFARDAGHAGGQHGAMAGQVARRVAQRQPGAGGIDRSVRDRCQP